MNIQTKDGIILRNIPDGTPEEQIKARIASIRNSRKTYDPTEGMTGTEKFLSGVGKGMTDLARGAGQLVGIVSDEDIAESSRMDAPLMKTGAGKAGTLSGTIATALPAAFIPGANTYAGATLTGMGLGALQPTTKDESRLMNIGLGGVGGAGGQLAGRTLGSGYRAVKGLLAPFFKSGQHGIAARTMQAFAGNADEAARNLAAAREIIPGSVPTSAEAAKDAGIAQLQRSLTNASPQLADDLAQRALEQNAARMAALQRVTGTPDDLASAMSTRSAMGRELYKDALGQKVRVDQTLKSLTSRPSMKEAIGRAAKIAQEEGQPFGNLFDKTGKFASVKGLHYVKMALDDMLDDVSSGIGKTQQRALAGTRDQLLKWLDKANPAYAQARSAFAEASKPINRMQVGQEILKRATGNQLPNIRGEMTLYPSAFGNVLKSGDKIAANVTGMRKGLSDVMTPEQMATLGALREDLARSVTGQNLGRAVGSNTSQNIVSQDILRQVMGPLGLPRSFSESAIANTIARPLQWVMQVPEQRIREQLAQALLDPKQAASLLQRAGTKPKVEALIKSLLGSSGVVGSELALQ